jgi:hypothetical protein
MTDDQSELLEVVDRPAGPPTEDELMQLLALVEPANPVLLFPRSSGPVFDFHFACFHRALSYLRHARRSETLATGYAASFWLDECRGWCRRYGLRDALEMSLRPFVAAIVASDVPFAPLTRFPHDLAFGLSPGYTARPNDAWRTVLAVGSVAGKMPTPIELPRVAGRVQELNVIVNVDRG